MIYYDITTIQSCLIACHIHAPHFNMIIVAVQYSELSQDRLHSLTVGAPACTEAHEKVGVVITHHPT